MSADCPDYVLVRVVHARTFSQLIPVALGSVSSTLTFHTPA